MTSDRITVRFDYMTVLSSFPGKMAMVSEFLGQLSLNIGVMSYFILYARNTKKSLILRWHRSHYFALNPQSHEPKYPTVVPAKDFDPGRDAARIETAIKTKGNIQDYLLLKKEFSAWFCNLSTDEYLVFVSQNPGLKCFDHTGITSKSMPHCWQSSVLDSD